MNSRLASLHHAARRNHGVVSIDQLELIGISRQMRSRLKTAGRVEPVGSRAYAVSGAPRTWHFGLAAGLADIGDERGGDERGGDKRGGDEGWIAGRSGARLLRLDGFTADSYEFLVPRHRRNTKAGGKVRSTIYPVPPTDVTRTDGLRHLRAERLIVESPTFHFNRREIENAIDSAIRMRLVDEQRLRERVLDRWAGRPRGAELLAALADTGGESRLERWFLTAVRHAGLAKPTLRRAVCEGGVTFARLDALFGARLVVELEGHATHSSRRQRQADEQRRTSLVLRGYVVLVFTYNDVRDRPAWVVAQLQAALAMSVASP